MREEVEQYLITDQICFREPKDSEITATKELLELQEEGTRPIIQFMEEIMRIKLIICHGLHINAQDPSLNNITPFLNNIDPWGICILHYLASECKSLSIPLALLHGDWTVKHIVDIARIDENFQIQRNGLVLYIYIYIYIGGGNSRSRECENVGNTSNRENII